jgi:hypothetical protein
LVSHPVYPVLKKFVGTCSITYMPAVAGDITIAAAYGGDANNEPGFGNAILHIIKVPSPR